MLPKCEESAWLKATLQEHLKAVTKRSMAARCFAG